VGQRDRPPTPPKVALHLRQEALFGCCRCGAPFVQYHHIVAWEVEEHFRPEDMMALCPYCHSIATAGAMPVRQQRSYKANPFNVKHGNSSGTLCVNTTQAMIKLASNFFMAKSPFIEIDGEEMLSLIVSDEGAIALSCKIYDQNDDLILELKENEWITGIDTPWDVQYKFNYIKVRSKPRHILLEIDARSDEEPVKMRANMYRHGAFIEMSPSKIGVGGLKALQFENCTFLDATFVIDTKAKTWSLRAA
jgi:hypothetical protein